MERSGLVIFWPLPIPLVGKMHIIRTILRVLWKIVKFPIELIGILILIDAELSLLVGIVLILLLVLAILILFSIPL